ncbi:MAG: flagellar hook-associated protein FlgK [Desulfuromonadaceae bacterium]|nr:flagellar hook-associated protein FlgK [Desulfuromonas sp.]MDY0185019.1 flagellar hook-associated protein FlgK [Desulfuromonadaceae bacterium]
MSLSGALNAAKTSLFTNQKGIEITGNNISNVNTPGYSRQKLMLSDFPSLSFGNLFVGQGVKASGIAREYDIFVAEQLLDKSRLLGAEDAKQTPLAELERVFNVGEENLATEIDRFFDSWQELSANPSGQVERDMVLQRGEILAKQFNTIARDLDTVSTNINSTIKSEVDSINLKLQQIADLNNRIQAIETGTGQSANSFRDTRDVLLQELTFTLGVQSFEERGGAVNVQLPGGLPLIQGSSALELQAIETGADISLQLKIGEATFAIKDKNLGGKFAGLMEIRDELIPTLKQDLDYTAYQMVQEVNSIHEQGEGLDGLSGRPFFQNPGRHESQAYPTNDFAGFKGGDIKITVDGEEYIINLGLATDQFSLEDVASAINVARDGSAGPPVIPGIPGIGSASARELGDGGFVLDILPAYNPATKGNSSISMDMSAIRDSYEAPKFSMPSMSNLIAMALKDPSKVAAGSSSAPGDNTKALEITALKDKKAVNGEDTFVGFYAKMAARVGIEASQNRLERAGAQDALTQLNNMRDGVAGVSLEEEMIALIKYQRGFEASARMLSIVDEMMETIISIKR